MKKYNDIYFANNVKQPKGGYLKEDIIFATHYDDGISLDYKDDIDQETINIAVSSLSKYILSNSPISSFKLSLLGAKAYAFARYRNYHEKYQSILNGLSLLNGLTKQSIYVAINLAQFARLIDKTNRPSTIKDLRPSNALFDAITVMVNRTVRYLRTVGPVGKINFDYIDSKPLIIDTAYLDFLTRTSLWDLSFSSSTPTEGERMRLLLHYIMFKHVNESNYFSFNKIGLFNPITNSSYEISLSDIKSDTLLEVEKLLGYKDLVFAPEVIPTKRELKKQEKEELKEAKQKEKEEKKAAKKKK